MKEKKLGEFKITFYSKKDFTKTVYTKEEGVQKGYDDFRYFGAVKDISEELASKIVDYNINNLVNLDFGFRDYTVIKGYLYPCKTAKDSFKTLSKLTYCTINKV